MKQLPGLVLFAAFVIFLNGCTQQVFGSKTSRPIPLAPLKPIKATLNVQKNWQIKTASAMGENKVHPFIDPNTVYIGGASSASAYNKANGKLLWKQKIGETISAGINGNAGSSNKNAQQIFLGTSNGNALSLDANTGKILWIERLSSEVLSVSPGKNGRVAFRTIDGKIHGLSSETGELIWQRSQRPPALTILGASVPVLVGPLVISGFDNGKVAAYNLQTGKPAWEVTIAIPRGRTELERIIDIDGRIKPLGNALFAASMNGNATGINMQAGELAWLRSFSTSTGVSVDPNGLYSSDDKGLIWKLDPQTGSPIWSMDDLKRYEPTLPVIINPSVVVVGDKKGNLHWINTVSGKFIARAKGDPAGYSVEPEVSGQSIYAIGKGGVLSRFSN